MLVQGSDIVYLMRLESDKADAWKLGYQTARETTETREYESTTTVDGTVKTPGEYEGTHSIGSVLPKGDMYVAKIKGAVRSPEPLHLWKIDRSDLDGSETLPGEYSKNVVTEVSTSANAEGNVEIDIGAMVSEGTVVNGEVTVTPALSAMLKTLADEIEFIQPTDGV